MDLKAVKHELAFWAEFVKTPRFIEGWVADCKTPELHTIAYDFIRAVTSPMSKVLDLGSGVVSILNGTVKKENLLACDPLGELYEIIFDYKAHGINPPIPLQAEDIIFQEEFDIVHMSNAIDHATDPDKIFANIASACKAGGFVILQGFENEGSAQGYDGMHQFDFKTSDKNGEEGIQYCRKDQKAPVNLVNPSLEVLKVYRFPNHYQGKTWYIYVAQKV